MPARCVTKSTWPPCRSCCRLSRSAALGPGYGRSAIGGRQGAGDTDLNGRRNVVRVKANGIEIEYETAGSKSDPGLLLIMGLGAQLTIWPDAFVRALADQGFYVIRFDNRDVGLSTDFGSWGVA